VIERHGGAGFGSSRAELQAWSVDVQRGEAHSEVVGHRQLAPMQARFDAKTPAHEIAAAIRNGAHDPRVQRTKDGGVQVLTREILPPGSQQTTGGRRRRFYGELDSELARGWARSHSTDRRIG
jgi:hypothetical protein